MRELDDSFAKLLGRQPTDAERQQLYRVKEALGLRNNDALWLVLIALQHYQDQYQRFPAAIAQAAQETLAGFRTAAEAQAKASAEAARADLAQAVARTAQEVAHQVAGKERIQWLIGSFVVAGLLFSGLGWFMNDQGFQAGYAAGYRETKDEKAAAHWANTPEGKAAYRLAQAGSIGALTRCDRPGWVVKDGICYPYAAANGVYGWRLP